jgi:hypothetical protein
MPKSAYEASLSLGKLKKLVFCSACITSMLNFSIALSLLTKVKPDLPQSDVLGEERIMMPASQHKKSEPPR